MATFTVYRVNLNGGLSHKEHLNNVDELNAWMASSYGVHATIRIESDRSGNFIIMTDDGEWFQEIHRSK